VTSPDRWIDRRFDRWLSGSARVARRHRRQEQFRRFDAWLIRLHNDAPLLFWALCTAIGLALFGVVEIVGELLLRFGAAS
jgi:hypothetical protein